MSKVQYILCGFCGKKIPKNNARKRNSQPQTCGRRCTSRLFWSEAKTHLLVKACLLCGKMFTNVEAPGRSRQAPNQFKKRKFCDTVCAVKSKTVNYNSIKYPDIKCRQCGNRCTPNRKMGVWYHLRRKYCSGACNSTARWAKLKDYDAKKRCVICRKTFSQRASWGKPHAPHIWAKKTTCSAKCTIRQQTKTRLDKFPAVFMSLVEKKGHNGCWRWVGSFFHKDSASVVCNYGVIVFPGKGSKAAHRVSYELYVGKIPKGKIIRHTCDNPWCVKPQHLLVGTRADNVQDMFDRNRQWKGPRKRGHTVGRMQPEDIERAIKMYATGEHTHKSIGKILDKDQSTIRKHLLARNVPVMSHKQKLLAQARSIKLVK